MAIIKLSNQNRFEVRELIDKRLGINQESRDIPYDYIKSENDGHYVHVPYDKIAIVKSKFPEDNISVSVVYS